MEIEKWKKRKFTENSSFKWPCPNCNNTSLELTKERFFSEMTVRSIELSALIPDEALNLTFTGVLKCKSCSEHIVFTGKGHPMPDYDSNGQTIYEDVFSPTYFEPTLNIFDIPENCPETVTIEIRNSFKLFWCDLPSCANKIRVSLEILLTENKVKRTVINKKGKRISISLDERIQIFDNDEIKDLLLAIKWIGNTGSHLGDLKPIDILETYQLLEYALIKLYYNQETKIKKITKEINKKRGPRKR